MPQIKTWLSSLFALFPEGRVKNIIRVFIYQLRKRSFYTVRYNVSKDMWRVNTKETSLLFKKNPYHVFSTNPLFFKHFPDWKPDLIVDAGAFHGTVGLFLAKKFPAAKVYLLEPDPASFSILVENIRLNNLSNAFPIKKGLWNKDGKVRFQHGNELSSAVVREEKPNTISIETISPSTLLSNYSQRKIFFKMNIEGAELEVLPACEILWKRNKMVLAVSSDHYINNEFTFKHIENFCKTHDMPFITEHMGRYKVTYISEKVTGEKVISENNKVVCAQKK